MSDCDGESESPAAVRRRGRGRGVPGQLHRSGPVAAYALVADKEGLHRRVPVLPEDEPLAQNVADSARLLCVVKARWVLLNSAMSDEEAILFCFKQKRRGAERHRRCIAWSVEEVFVCRDQPAIPAGMPAQFHLLRQFIMNAVGSVLGGGGGPVQFRGVHAMWSAEVGLPLKLLPVSLGCAVALQVARGQLQFSICCEFTRACGSRGSCLSSSSHRFARSALGCTRSLISRCEF